MKTKYKYFLISLLVSLGIDQATKIWARSSLRDHAPISVIGNNFVFNYAENRDSAFGIIRGFPGAQYFFLVVGAVAMFVVWRYLRQSDDKLRRVPAELGLLAGGAIGNVVDRLIFGYVTDFVVWRAAGHQWPTFNIADAALVVGVIGLILDWKPKP